MDLYPYGRTDNTVSRNWLGLEAHKCDMCGKYHRVVYWTYTQWFKTLDGGDNMSLDECWQCKISGAVRAVVHSIKRRIKVMKSAHELWAVMTKLPWYSRKRLTDAVSFARRIG